jgi:exoribonuclease II
MIEHGFQPEFPAGADTTGGYPGSSRASRRSRSAGSAGLLWSSIDNDTSKDLDQIEWAEQLPDGRIRVLVGVADVDVRVTQGTVLDDHAKSETTSVYTGVKVFPMLPAELSEGITSLNENEDRVAMVIEFCVDQAGTVSDGKAYRALVRNRAQLAYNGGGSMAWPQGLRRPRWPRMPTWRRSSSCRTLRRSAWRAAASSTGRWIWKRWRRAP